MRRKWASFLLAVAMMWILTGCASETKSQETTQPPAQNQTETKADKHGGTLRIGLDVDASTFDPRLGANTTEGFMDRLVFSALVRVEADGSIKGELAEKWEQPNETTWIFHLRGGVKFHDGRPLTAEDVKYTMDTVLNKDFGSRLRSTMSVVQSVVVESEQRVRFELSRPHATFLYQLGFGIVPKHVVEAVGQQAFVKNPVGSGPFRFVRHKPAEEIVVQAFADYFEGRPFVDEVQLKVIPAPDVRAIAFERGDVDVIHYPIAIEALARLDGNKEIKVHRSPSSSILYIGFNHKDPIMGDVAVRRAVSYATDRQGIINGIWQGEAEPAVSMLPPGNLALNDKVPNYAYNLDRAKETLTAAGWTPGGDGIRVKNGQRLKVVLMTHSEDGQRVQTVQYLQNLWKQVGIDTEVKVKDWPAFSTDFLVNKDYQAVVVGFSGMFDPDYALYQKFATGAGQNWFNYSNLQVDQLLEGARKEQDTAKRADLYRQAQQILLDDAVWGVVHWNRYMVATRSNVQGIEPIGIKISFADSVRRAWIQK